MTLLLRGMIAVLIMTVFIHSPAYAKKLDVQKELAYRVEFGSPGDVRYLLEKGGDPNGVNKLGWPLVSVASRRTDGLAVEMLEILTEAGAELNQGGPSRQYPIIIAARNGDKELAEYLLLEGVDTDVRDRNGVQPVEIAKYYGHEDVFDILEELALKRAEQEEAMRSPERYEELRHNLAYEYCAVQYMHYYFSYEKSKYTDEYIDDHMTERRNNIYEISNDLYQIFHMPWEDMNLVREEVSEEVYGELEEMISPRNRRKLGVGSEKDLNERCTRIAEAWHKEQTKDEKKDEEKQERRELRRGGAIMIR